MENRSIDKTMRVGILTLPLKNNYGGILQNWALQQILIDKGYKPITIDAHVSLSFQKYVKNICRWIYYHHIKGMRFEYPHRYKTRNSFKLTGKFVEKNIIKTRPLQNYEERLIDEYSIDCVIVGSDQVWRPKYNAEIENMFLGFLKNRNIKKLAYGVSFGSDEWEFSQDLTQKCSCLVKQFNAVSVRETSGVVLCREHLNIDAVPVLDPTLLVEKEKYESLCEGVRRKTKPFLAVYCLDRTESKMNLFSRIAKAFNLKIRVFSADQDVKLSVPQWLAMFRDASMVVTDSFHGTAFSILFEKQFYSLINSERGNARVISLLGQLDLKNQIINETTKSFSTVDYSHVNDKLLALRSKSVHFLTKNLKEYSKIELTTAF